MFNKNFITGFLISSILSLVIIVLCHEFLLKDNHLYFLLATLAYFVISCIFIHRLALNAIKSENKYSFSRVTILNTFMKLLIMVSLVVIYKMTFPEKSIEFVWPFFAVYIIFTVFETKFLMKLAKH